jgi:lysophospholipase L1-like esterase
MPAANNVNVAHTPTRAVSTLMSTPLCFLLTSFFVLYGAPPAKKKPAAPVSPQARAKANRTISTHLETIGPLENAAALVPFFEMLYRQKTRQAEAPVHILHFGDSHTAADDWTGDLRTLFQSGFGDGGAGFSLAGHPFRGYRRFDISGGASRGWRTQGLARANGDGRFGLGGVSIETESAGERVSVEADCELLEVYYLQQPEGGELALVQDGRVVLTFSTRGELGPGYFSHRTTPGVHSFALCTMERAPVRLFGWVTDKARGVTYEALGINGAEASVFFKWDEQVLASNLSRRNPSLIVLAYGTNEAGSPHWDQVSYREMFSALLVRLQAWAPAASTLVIGPPDRYYRYKRRLKPLDKVDAIVAAQRQACQAAGCAFWDTRARMGGKGSMRQWVIAGWAQRDYVHFLSEGYRLLGNTLFKDIMQGYAAFLKAREEKVESAEERR